MEISLLDFLIISLASFRLTRLIVFDSITEFIRKPFFNEDIVVSENGEEELIYIPKKGKITGFVGSLLSCYWCTGIWASIAVCFTYFYWPAISIPILIVLAVAGVAAIIETVVQVLL